MKLQLYSFGESGHSYKVALALHFSKANWEQIFIDFFQGEARSEAFKNEINTMVPVPSQCKVSGKLLTEILSIDEIDDLVQKTSNGGAVDLIFYGLILMIICIFRPNGLISFIPKDILERKKQR